MDYLKVKNLYVLSCITQKEVKMEKKKRKRSIKESEKHAILKKIAKRFLKEFFGVREEDIYEDFPIGDHIFDIIAYPKRSRKGASRLSIISSECGNLGTKNCIDCLKKIEDMLDFVDLVIWVPYSIFYNPFADILGSISFSELDKKGRVKFSTEEFDLHKVPMKLRILKTERRIKNITTNEDFISGLAFCKGYVYKRLKKAGQKFLHE